MHHYDELDQDIVGLGTPTRCQTLADATVFVHALRKIAEAGQPAPDADLVQHQTEVAVGEEASPMEAAVHTQAGAPDESGHLEGEFAVDIGQVVMTLAQLVSNSMRQHTAYTFYGEMMRDVGRGELAELFQSQAYGEINEMRYFLRRMSVLQPGGVPIPVAPTPEPSPDVGAALKYLIAGEQQAIVLFKTLHSMLGDNPMKYTLEQMMTDAQEHLDKLWQYMPASEAPEQAAMPEKVAIAVLRRKIAMLKAASPQKPVPQPGDVPVGAPGTEPLSAVLGRENLLQQAQLMNENADLRARMDQAAQQQLMQQQQMESMTAENESLQMQAMESSGAAQMATEQAQMSSEQAAAQADAKMRLSIRIQQLRQNLADIVSQDPVQEEGVGFGEQAGPGSVATSSQQNAMAQEAAAMDPSGGAGGAPSAEAAQQQAEAAGAQQEAKEQTEEAKAKTKEDSAKKPGAGTTVSVKTSALPGAVHRPLVQAGHSIGEGIGKHLERAGGDAMKGGLNTLKERIRSHVKDPKVVAAAGLGTGAALGAKAHGIKKQNDRDKTQKDILSAVQSLANR